MFNQTEVKQEVAETTCKREIEIIDNEVLLDTNEDTFKTEFKDDATREITSTNTNNDTFDDLDVKKCDIKAKIEQDDGLCCKDMKTDVSSLLTNDDKSDSNLNQYIVSHTNVNTEGQSFICIICKKPLSSNSSLEQHMRTHTDEKPFECEICFKQISTKGSLTVHMTVHTDENPFECEICNKYFSTKSYLKIHKKLHSG
uniref:Zinc finger protein 570-like n=1 Tax=Diabrotica virgifera virgifera TaxID=50390 RepID=A0A6P7GR31_DIAVI